MHEHIITEEIIKKANSLGKVSKIVVECGQLAHLPAKELEKVLKQKCKYPVVVLEKEAIIECTECGFIGKPNILEHAHDVALFECPKCHAIPQILEGDKIILKSVDVED